MTTQIAMFKFTLGNGQSIGPGELKSMWVRASRSADVSVGRQIPAFGREERPVYSLYAPQHLPDLAQVETRLRQMLEDAKLAAALVPLHR